MIERHFAWFRRDSGRWIAEWRGLVPLPDLPPNVIGDARLRLINAWQQHIVTHLGEHQTLEECSDLTAWSTCPSGGAVSLDVTRFQWPLGDHVWHRWDETDHALDWPASSGHKFIVINETLQVVGNTHSHRPVRSVPELRVIDITDSPFAEYWGSIWGRFVWRGDRWGFVPRVVLRKGVEDVLASVPAETRKSLEAASVDTVADALTAIRERVHV